MSGNKKKLYVRIVCGALAALMVLSCVAILAPIF